MRGKVEVAKEDARWVDSTIQYRPANPIGHSPPLTHLYVSTTLHSNRCDTTWSHMVSPISTPACLH